MALQAADAQHLALAQRKADAAEPAAAGEIGDLQRDPVGRGGDALGIEPVEVAADHLGDDLLVGDGVRLMGGHGASIPEDGESVGNRPDLGHAMGDEDDQPAFSRQLARELKQPVCLAGGERGCRLVEDQDARVLGQPLGDLDDLPFGEREAAQLLVGA